MTGTALFETVVHASGLDKVVAPFTVRRLLMRVGVLEIARFDPSHLPALLGHLRTELRKYLREASEYDAALRRLEDLARGSAPPGG